MIVEYFEEVRTFVKLSAVAEKEIDEAEEVSDVELSAEREGSSVGMEVEFNSEAPSTVGVSNEGIEVVVRKEFSNVNI